MNISPIGNAFRLSIFKKPSNTSNIRYNYSALFVDSVSFKGKKPPLKIQIEQMPKESLLPLRYREYLISELSKPDNEKDLIDIHKEYYSGLLDCETLDEAKEKYPEFSAVVDAKDIDLYTLNEGKKTLIQISRGCFKKAPDLTIDNFSLELLKKYYAQLLSIRQPENYWKIDKSTIYSLLELLNIQMSPEYAKMIASAKVTKINKARWQDPNYRKTMTDSAKAQWQDPNYRKTMTDSAKAQWQDDNYRQKMSETSKANWQNPEYREKMTETYKANWQNPEYRERMAQIASETLTAAWQNPKFRDKMSKMSRDIMKANWQNDDYRQKITKVSKANWQNPEYVMRMKIVRAASALAWEMHPECAQVYSDIAKDFHPMLVQIIRKKEARKELTKAESSAYNTYFKRCNEAKLNVDGKELRVLDIIGQCQRDILSSWGFYEENRDIYKIAQNIGILNS